MRILILSFYFRPDLSACSFRSTALVEALHRVVPPGSQIDVVTTAPNRYHSFAVDAPDLETQGNVQISRIAIPPHKSGFLDQARAFLVFSRKATRLAATRDYDIVFATSSRLMTAVLGAWIARTHRAKLYLDIRDIFVDTIQDVLPRKFSLAAKPVFGWFEGVAINSADKVNLVSRGFSAYFAGRYPRQTYSYYTNGVDAEFTVAAPARSVDPGDHIARIVTVVYAGNIGEGQGLHAILPDLAIALNSVAKFRIIGDGGRLPALRAALSAHGVTNVELLTPLPRDRLLDEYRAADVLFLHLNDHEAFKKVLPSKIFEYAALGKPVWAGVAGYAADFIESEVSNSAVFRPCDVGAAVRSFGELQIQDAPRTSFIAKYARAAISDEMAKDILSLSMPSENHE